MVMTILAWLLTLLVYLPECLASVGDQSYVFAKCVKGCLMANCTNLETFMLRQPMHLQLLQWDCNSECRYTCMWITVDAFIKDGLPIPQFNGKWPFLRLFGIQEPASTLFSVGNALCCLAIFHLRTKISSNTHMFYVWHVVALVSLNAWLCSVVFHTRDFDITEKLDYYFAFSVVCVNLWAFCCRTLGTNSIIKVGAFSGILLGVYLKHVYYLHYIKMDYGYNMMINVIFGLLNTVAWSVWSLWHIKKQHYVWKCIFSVVAISSLLSLELLDFPPLFWHLDAHSLWHAGTIPLALLWISFTVDDCKYLEEKREESRFKLD